MEKWSIRFLLGKRDLAAKLDDFLKEKLNPAYTHEVQAGNVIVGNCKDKNDGWKVALWVKHRSGLRPQFSVQAVDENGSVTYLGSCGKCKTGKDGKHTEHL